MAVDPEKASKNFKFEIRLIGKLTKFKLEAATFSFETATLTR